MFCRETWRLCYDNRPRFVLDAIRRLFCYIKQARVIRFGTDFLPGFSADASWTPSSMHQITSWSYQISIKHNHMTQTSGASIPMKEFRYDRRMLTTCEGYLVNDCKIGVRNNWSMQGKFHITYVIAGDWLLLIVYFHMCEHKLVFHALSSTWID